MLAIRLGGSASARGFAGITELTLDRHRAPSATCMRTAHDRLGPRSPAWLNVKPKL